MKIGIPSEVNVSIKVVEKLSKYKNIEIEVTKMWEMKTSTVATRKGRAWTHKERT